LHDTVKLKIRGLLESAVNTKRFSSANKKQFTPITAAGKKMLAVAANAFIDIAGAFNFSSRC